MQLLKKTCAIFGILFCCTNLSAMEAQKEHRIISSVEESAIVLSEVMSLPPVIRRLILGFCLMLDDREDAKVFNSAALVRSLRYLLLLKEIPVLQKEPVRDYASRVFSELAGVVRLIKFELLSPQLSYENMFHTIIKQNGSDNFTRDLLTLFLNNMEQIQKNRCLSCAAGRLDETPFHYAVRYKLSHSNLEYLIKQLSPQKKRAILLTVNRRNMAARQLAEAEKNFGAACLIGLHVVPALSSSALRLSDRSPILGRRSFAVSASGALAAALPALALKRSKSGPAI